MRGKKARRNLYNAYIDDMADEMIDLEAVGLPADGTEINDGVQPFWLIDLPSGMRCRLVKSSLAVCTLGAIGAVAVYLVTDGKAEAAVIVDRLYEQLSERGRRFILAHEAGHFYHGHLGTPEDAVASLPEKADLAGAALKNRSLEREYLADQYAAEVNGKRDTIAAMKEFRQLMAKNRWIKFDAKEIDRRIRHLMKLQLQQSGSRLAG